MRTPLHLLSLNPSVTQERLAAMKELCPEAVELQDRSGKTSLELMVGNLRSTLRNGA